MLARGRVQTPAIGFIETLAFNHLSHLTGIRLIGPGETIRRVADLTQKATLATGRVQHCWNIMVRVLQRYQYLVAVGYMVIEQKLDVALRELTFLESTVTMAARDSPRSFSASNIFLST